MVEKPSFRVTAEPEAAAEEPVEAAVEATLKKIVVIIRDVFIILFYVMVTYGGYQLCTRAKQAVSTMPQFTMGQVYTIFPIAGVLCILSAVLNLVVELTTKPEGGESK